MEWNIRGGVVEDAAALTKLNQEELGYDYPEAKTREHLAALLAVGEEWARSVGAVAVRLVSGESRKGAHAFYQNLGYQGNKLQRNFKKPV